MRSNYSNLSLYKNIMLANKSVRKANENYNTNCVQKNGYSCTIHPEKQATHQLIGSECNDTLFYC